MTQIVDGQEPARSPAPEKKQDDEVLRIDTRIIQTGFYVVDKGGSFVKGLKKEDFDLRIDGKAVPTLFFEQVTGSSPSTKNSPNTAPESAYVRDVRRTMVFVVDDLHLGPATLTQARKMIHGFIDEQMLATDRVAIVSSGGKVGFLQQFTSDKAVLRAAADRLIYSALGASSDQFPPPMDEYIAQSVERGDRSVTNYFVGLTVRADPSLPRQMAESVVQSRARAVLARTRVISSTSLTALEESIRQSAVFPGRKAIFFISDGFLLDPGNTDASKRLNSISDAATRSNAVIYSFDANGLEFSMPDDTSGIGFQIQSASRFERQDALSFVATNTGGKFIRNTNALSTKLAEVANEAFTYYLLAWEPESENTSNDKLKRIEVVIKGRPELKTLVQKGYLASQTSAQTPAKAADKNSGVAASKAAGSEKKVLQPNGLSTAVAVRYLDLPDKGSTLLATVQIGTDGVEFSESEGTMAGNVEISGVIFDADGKSAKDFKVPVDIKIPPGKLRRGDGLSFNYDYDTTLKPGLYQLRVTTRDTKSGRSGLASQWIEIPDLASHHLTVSSLIFGERQNDSRTKSAEGNPLIRKVENLFERTSSLRFTGFIYNASGAKPEIEPDVAIQMQIIRQGKITGSGKANLIVLEPKDNARIPFTGEFFLDTFAPAVYELKLIVTDNRTKKQAIQTSRFEVL